MVWSSLPEKNEPLSRTAAGNRAYKFVCDVNGGKTCQFFLFVYLKLSDILKRCSFILERSQGFSLGEVEKDLSQAALVAGVMKISLHNVITFIISRSELGSS